MCGQYGVLGRSLFKIDLEVFNTLAILNQFRGWDATGILRVWSSGRTEVRQDTCTAQEFYRRKENHDILESTIPVALMGHNRWATVGKADDKDGVHPFTNEQYIGFHNGTLIEDRFKNNNHYVTDSEALYAEMAEKGMEDTLASLSKDSAFALSFYNRETKRIGFVRNGKRSLYFATNQKRDVVYYSSSARDLYYACGSAGLEVDVYTLPEWQLFECNPDKIGFADWDSNDKSKGRTSLWFIENIEPKPIEPVKVEEKKGNVWRGPLAGLFESDGDTTSQTQDGPSGASVVWNYPPVQVCCGCGDHLLFPTLKNKIDKKYTPVHITEDRFACHQCADMWGYPWDEDDLDKPTDLPWDDNVVPFKHAHGMA